jgi:hypothetical protein
MMNCLFFSDLFSRPRNKVRCNTNATIVPGCYVGCYGDLFGLTCLLGYRKLKELSNSLLVVVESVFQKQKREVNLSFLLYLNTRKKRKKKKRGKFKREMY